MKQAYQQDDIIAAISTPLGTGGIGIVRMSGAGSIALADSLFQGKQRLSDKPSHTLSYGTWHDVKTGICIDEVLVSVMRAPQTYTKEDIVEVNCHGGALVTKKVLESLLLAGARLAQAGEFTKRAFLSGRMDLAQAEAVIDLIHSPTEIAREAAVNQLGGRLTTLVQQMRSELIDMIAAIEAVIDYPEDDIEEETYAKMEQNVSMMIQELERLLATADRGKILREGLETVIVGKPNVGKSSLLNWLLEEERAIVTDIAGTTRDTVEEYLNLDGIPMKLVDTAGIRETGDVVERMGVEKSKEYAKRADLVLLMLDASKALEAEDLEILSFIDANKTLVLLNKTDLEPMISMQALQQYLNGKQIISVSVKENSGMEELVSCLKEMFFAGESISAEQALVGNTRHKVALEQAKEALLRTKITIESRMPEDFISMDLQQANQALGEITGDVVDEEIIDRIFTKFCLGK